MVQASPKCVFLPASLLSKGGYFILPLLLRYLLSRAASHTLHLLYSTLRLPQEKILIPATLPLGTVQRKPLLLEPAWTHSIRTWSHLVV